jgi:aldose 1-epimerase
MNQITRQHYLTNPFGEVIYLFTLKNNSGTQVRLTNYGGIIISYCIPLADGRFNDIVLGFDHIEDYWSPAYLKQHPWFGAAVGRYANRIKNARFELDGKVYQLTKNNGEEQLHGGIRGFDRKVWQVLDFGDKPFPFVEFGYSSPDGEEGFPGELHTILRYELKEGTEFSYRYTATTNKPTPVNLTQHSYFNLDNGQGTIRDQLIRIPASHTLEQEHNLVVTGRLLDVTGTPFDLRNFVPVGKGLETLPEYDTTFVLDNPSTDGKPVLAAELKSDRSGITLQLFTTELVIHFYSGKWIPPVTGKYNTDYKPFSGLCLEAHKHPNAVNIPSFPDTILRPGQQYMNQTTYKVI